MRGFLFLTLISHKSVFFIYIFFVVCEANELSVLGNLGAAIDAALPVEALVLHLTACPPERFAFRVPEKTVVFSKIC